MFKNTFPIQPVMNAFSKSKFLRVVIFTTASAILMVLTAMSGDEALEKQQMRKWFMASIDSKDTAYTFHNKMKGYEGDKPLMIGYKGASKAFLARYAWNPVNKMNFLENGMKLVDRSIGKDPNDIELRFIRLSITYYLPDFLGYGDHINDDKRVIMGQLKQDSVLSKPAQVKKVIIEFLLDSDLCSEKEKERLKDMT